MMNNHNFHLVSHSPWPILVSSNMINLGFSLGIWLSKGFFFFFFFFFLHMLLISYQWWRDIIREGLFEGSHSIKVNSGLSMGFISFVISELFFFVSFFWMYFYFSLSPDICMGFCWPPLGFELLDYKDIPFFNTLILLSSGFFITWSHYSLLSGKFLIFSYCYFFSLLMGFYFLSIQLYEYYNLSFDFSDGVFGCSFFILTGFHGFHVLVGIVFLMVNYFRFFNNSFSFLSFFGFEYSIWYWHFVDLIWLFLYLFLYWWGM